MHAPSLPTLHPLANAQRCQRSASLHSKAPNKHISDQFHQVVSSVCSRRASGTKPTRHDGPCLPDPLHTYHVNMVTISSYSQRGTTLQSLGHHAVEVFPSTFSSTYTHEKRSTTFPETLIVRSTEVRWVTTPKTYSSCMIKTYR